MPIVMNVKADFSQANKLFFDLETKYINRAALRALNRTIKQVKTAAVKELKKEVGKATGLSSGGLKKTIKEKKAHRNNLRAQLLVSGRALPLIRFGARQVGQGVSAAAWGKRRTYRGAFIAKMPSGHKGVFKRVSGRYMASRAGSTKHSEALEELWGPSLPKEFAKQKIINVMQKKGRQVWVKNFQRELNFELSKLK